MDIMSLHALMLSWFIPIPSLWRISLVKAFKGNLRPPNKEALNIYLLQNWEHNTTPQMQPDKGWDCLEFDTNPLEKLVSSRPS